MLVYATVLLCAAGLAVLVWRYDLHDREPPWLLLLTAALGFVVMRATGHIEDWLFRALFDGLPTTLDMALVAATFEESGKLGIVILIAVFFRRHFNDPMDGLVYGAFAGLGMAIEESLHYLSFAELNLATTGQEVVRIMAHHLLGAIGGFAIGMARFRMRGWGRTLAACFGASLGLHAAWDYVSGTQLEHLTTTGYHRAACIALMLTAMAIFAALVRVGSEMSRRRFEA